MQEITISQMADHLMGIVRASGALSVTRQVFMPVPAVPTLEITWEWGFSIGAHLSVRFAHMGEHGYAAPQVEVAWGTTNYTPAQGRNAANLHTLVVDLACRFDSEMFRKNILPFPATDAPGEAIVTPQEQETT